ncbi:aspartate 1-decarboxylase [Coprothermobacter platensis]|uniref:aspartate 1-decarboxylase n=1 Tax=Coprothermobacter platensis TaxID=108819 RepID=UPI0003619B70|nr:aspartate 1-decarboxylase [Coprothermobacter platensis]
MTITVLKSKVHNARVTVCNVEYEGSLSLDEELIKKANMVPYERILVVNVSNGERFETYLIPAEAGSKEVGLNGAAARLAVVGDPVIIMSFAQKEPQEQVKATILIMDEHNNVKDIKEVDV